VEFIHRIADPGPASTLFAALFSFVLIFCGVTQPPPQMPYFWRSWMPPLSPFTYFIEVSVVLHAKVSHSLRGPGHALD
jgi:ABC-type multidrug transport system permease subunit